MIDYNDLINRIENMQDLPVSEEMLGAYSEGTLSSVEAAGIDNIITSNTELCDLVRNLDLFDEFQDNPKYSGTNDIEIPQVLSITETDLCNFNETFDNEIISFNEDDSFFNDNNSLNIESENNYDDFDI